MYALLKSSVVVIFLPVRPLYDTDANLNPFWR